ncbi:MAG: ribose 5-phosphate isomerase B [Planctomycetaceae bacterium]
MKIAVASDHRGVDVKRNVLELLGELGLEVVDFGPDSSDSVDYPDFAGKVAQVVSDGAADRGILVCGTGLGMSIAANKFPNVQATPCHDELTAKMSRLHNNSNILCVSADLLGDNLIGQMVRTWLSTEFEGGRHARRLEKIRILETEHCREFGQQSDSH